MNSFHPTSVDVSLVSHMIKLIEAFTREDETICCGLSSWPLDIPIVTGPFRSRLFASTNILSRDVVKMEGDGRTPINS